MKITLLLMCCFICNGLTFAQDDLYYSNTKAVKDTITIGNDLENIKYCLAKYHDQRMTGLAVSLSSGLFGGVSYALNDNSIAKPLLVLSGLLGITSAIIYIDSEKWLKRASLSVSPGGFKITF
jgi:hypothetical protein